MPTNETTKLCPQCGRTNASSRSACLYCGTQFHDSLEGEHPSSPIEKPDLSPLARLERAKALAEARSHQCPNCKREAERIPLKVEFWKYKRYSIWGRRRYFDVLSTSVPGYCKECTEALRWKKIRASFFLSAPIWFIMGIAILGFVGFSAAMTVLYFGWILRGCRYSWTDGSVYGDELENDLRPELSSIEHPPGARVEFPIGGSQTFIRAVLIPAAPILLILLLSAFVGVVHFFRTMAAPSEISSPPATSRESVGFQALSQAFAEKNEALVAQTLAKYPDVVRERDVDGKTALHLAVKTNNANIVTALLDKGAELEATENKGQATPLHFAVLGSYYISTKALLSRNANINAKMKDGATPLLIASLFPNPGLAKVLVEHGANVNETQNDGESALSYAKSHHRTELEQILRAAGARD